MNQSEKIERQEELDAIFQERLTTIRNALFAEGWRKHESRYWPLSRNEQVINVDLEHVGTGWNVVGVTWKIGDLAVRDNLLVPVEKTLVLIKNAIRMSVDDDGLTDVISIKEAWDAAGGNSLVNPTKRELIFALRSMDESLDESDGGEPAHQKIQPKEVNLPYGIRIDFHDNGTTGISSGLLREFAGDDSVSAGDTEPDIAAKAAAGAMESLLLAMAIYGVDLSGKEIVYAIKMAVESVVSRMDSFVEALPSSPLNPTQQRVAAIYCDGEYKHVSTEEDAANVGDGLFTFLINEANDVPDIEEFVEAMGTALDQLETVRYTMREELENTEMKSRQRN